MKFEPGGKYQWDGVYLPAEDSEIDEQEQFGVWADTMEEAVKAANETLPDGAFVVFLQRGVEVGDASFELPDDHPTVVALEEMRKKSLH